MQTLTELSKYLFIILLLLFSLRDYTYFRKKEENRRKVEGSQLLDIYIFNALGFMLIYLNTWDAEVILLMIGVFIYTGVTFALFRALYPKGSVLLVNNMLMLLSIGFVMIARIRLQQAVKQFLIAAAGTVLALIVPVIIRKIKVLSRLTWLYAGIGIVCLLGVLALAVVSGGAKLSVEIGGVTVQFSEVVKITLVFFIASMMAKDASRKGALITTVVAFIHIGLLVLSRDLGTAAVFFAAYLAMILAATRKFRYAAAGLLAGGTGAVAAYFLFDHVKQRVTAWRDPFSVYDGAGYQIVQGLFAISAGGWMGTGLCQGSPGSIPVAVKDYIFAAICEEFGSVFGICLILVCMSMFLLIVNMSLEIHRTFYKLIALGLGVEYAFQVFLTIGGVTKFIPMTGITLPLVAYGGSSVVSTLLMLAIIQGLYMLREDEEEEIAKAVAEQF